MGRRIELEGHTDCTECPLHKTRIQVVPGFGNPKSKIIVVGEAPGAEEDAAGRPFVGQAGQLLRAIIDSVGLDSTELFYTNIYHCRPVDNKIETAKGSPCPDIWLMAELQKIMRPSAIAPNHAVIVATGRTPISYFWPKTEKTLMRDLVGQSSYTSNMMSTVVACYHPSYALRMGTEDWEANFAIKSIQGVFSMVKEALSSTEARIALDSGA